MREVRTARSAAAMSAAVERATPAAAVTRRGRNYARNYWPFMVPAGVVVAAIIVFPWVFTLYMSVHDWHIGSPRDAGSGAANYARLLTDERFQCVDPAHAVLHRAGGILPDGDRHRRGGVLRAQFPVARHRANDFHHADDGDAGGESRWYGR